MQILTAFALGVSLPDAVEQALDLKGRGRPRAPVGSGAVLEAAPCVSALVSPTGCSWLRLFLFQSDLRQDAHQEFVHVMVDRHRGLDILAVVGGCHAFALCKNVKNTKHIRSFLWSRRGRFIIENLMEGRPGINTNNYYYYSLFICHFYTYLILEILLS